MYRAVKKLPQTHAFWKAIPRDGTPSGDDGKVGSVHAESGAVPSLNRVVVGTQGRLMEVVGVFSLGASGRGSDGSGAPGISRMLRRRWADGVRAFAIFLLLLLAVSAVSTAPAEAAKYAAIVIDANSGRVLHQSHADAPRYPASLTKMMTLYIVFDMLRAGRVTLDTRLRISENAASQPPSKLRLKPGSTIRLGDAIRALVTKSANDVATAIAENLAGSETKFARYMTWRARQIGMTRTTFRNASGLPDPYQTTTARDMATLALRLIDDHPNYYRFFKLRYFRYGGRRYRNHNGLLFNFKGTDGIKTGYTRASGFNLVASVRRGRKHLIGVVMGGKSAGQRNRRMRALLSKAFGRAAIRLTRRRTRATPFRLAALDRLPARGYTGLTRAAPGRAFGLVAPVPSIVRRGVRPGFLSGAERGASLAPEPARAVPTRRSTLRARVPAPTPAIRTAAVGREPPRPAPATATRAIARPAIARRPPIARRGAAPSGHYHVQVGAHATSEAARRALRRVAKRAGGLLAGARPVLLPYKTAGLTWYRARFAGFSKSEAQSACRGLKRRRIDCLVLPAE